MEGGRGEGITDPVSYVRRRRRCRAAHHRFYTHRSRPRRSSRSSPLETPRLQTAMGHVSDESIQHVHVLLSPQFKKAFCQN